MKGFVAVLIVLLNFMLIAQPALAEEPNQKIIFSEKIPGLSNPQYLNLSQDLADLVGNEGIYYGPSYPFVLYQIESRDTTDLYINYTINLTSQEVMNGAWEWKFLIPIIGNIQDLGIKINGNWALKPVSQSYHAIIYWGSDYITYYRDDQTNFYDLQHFHLINKTKYGIVIQMIYPLFPGQYTFSIYAKLQGDFNLHIVRENSLNTTVTILQNNKIVLNIPVGIAYDFLQGWGDNGMGGITIPKDRMVYFQISKELSQTEKYITFTLPIYTRTQNTITIKFKYHNESIGDTYDQFNVSLNPGFYYLINSTAHKADEILSVEIKSTEPLTLLFCSKTQNKAFLTDSFNYTNTIEALNSVNYTMLSNSIDLTNLGIVANCTFTEQQFATVTQKEGITIYNLGFAQVKEYADGTYIITKKGTYTVWEEYKNITVKSLGTQLSEDIFGKNLGGGDILSVIVNTGQATLEYVLKIWDLLKQIGNIIWASLLKFVNYIVSAANWILDNVGMILQYLLYIAMPTALMFIVAYTSRYIKGLRTRWEGEENANK